jgi:hypothetical protein
MTRALYRCLVWLHPPYFRREFGGEMLWIFDEAAQTGAVSPLIADVLISLARQWCLRSSYWKFALAPLGALFQVTLGSALIIGIGQGPGPSNLSVAENPELAALMRLATLTAVGLVAAIMFLVVWWRSLARRTGV